LKDENQAGSSVEIGYLSVERRSGINDALKIMTNLGDRCQEILAQGK
jgi:hypothetical protein